jgi:hypothetical protein
MTLPTVNEGNPAYRDPGNSRENLFYFPFPREMDFPGKWESLVRPSVLASVHVSVLNFTSRNFPFLLSRFMTLPTVYEGNPASRDSWNFRENLLYFPVFPGNGFSREMRKPSPSVHVRPVTHSSSRFERTNECGSISRCRPSLAL